MTVPLAPDVLSRMRGDYAVPTLFDGNFDAIFKKVGGTLPIPGWSSVGQDSLKKWSELNVPELNIGYQDNYALKLDADQSTTHSSFVVPDWGALRFDLHTGNVAVGSTGTLKVFLDLVDSPNSNSNPVATVSLSKAVGDDARQYFNDRYRIGYGETGFETFTVNIDENLRGKVANLRFQLENGNPVYLDNVFFKSQHLLLGNPELLLSQSVTQGNTSLNIQQEARNDASNFSNNYLLEKPQFAISYNFDNQSANWVSYQLDRSWIGSDQTRNFSQDRELPTGWYKVKDDDYTGSGYDRGHLTALQDRTRNTKDRTAVNLMTNIIPQAPLNNQQFWQYLEGDLRDEFVDTLGKTLYVITGVSWSKGRIEKASSPGLNLNIPDHLWKVVLVSDSKISSFQDILPNSLAFGIYVQNEDSVAPDAWLSSTYVKSVKEIESLTGYNFFSSLPDAIESNIEQQDWSITIPRLQQLLNNARSLSSPLMADIDESVLLSALAGHNGLLKDAALKPSLDFIQFGSTEVGSSEISSTSSFFQIGSPQISFYKAGSQNTGSSKIGIPQVGLHELSSFEESSIHLNSTEVSLKTVSPYQSSSSKNGVVEISTPQNSAGQISKIQDGAAQVGIFQIGSDHLDPFQLCSRQVNSSQISFDKTSVIGSDTTEISFSSSVALQQFLSSHNTSPTSIYDINNTALTLWNTYLQPTTPLNLTIEIKDLPTGQLAEATITGFDPTGHPNSGTLYLDIDANGLGWFIDTNPWDNSEYSQTLTDTAYRATSDSAAYAHYDLLTTILHETAHLQGIIAGYSNYDSHIQAINGSKTFIGDSFSAILTPDISY